MTALLNRDDVPKHLTSLPELDLSGDMFAERLGKPWFRLAARTVKTQRDERGVEDEKTRHSLLIGPDQFQAIFDKLTSVGNVTHGLGEPGGCLYSQKRTKEYSYTPFYKIQIPFTTVIAEPLAFVRFGTSGTQLFINPDLWLFFELEEKTLGQGIWWDPRRGVDALIRRTLDGSRLETVEIRTDYLLKYLQARQMSLLIGQYRQLLLFAPSRKAVEAFVKGDLILGSAKQGAKVIVQNWGLRNDCGRAPFLQRRLHLWFEVQPQEIDLDDPWAEIPPFDSVSFTLPTAIGPVAPARWKHSRGIREPNFAGEVCDFMDRVYFRQEVLTKYEGASGFEVADDGSVLCRGYWALNRSTSRIGNELLATAIGDFAEGVPFEEWRHWQQYSVEPPSSETASALTQEQPIPDAVNSLARALLRLNSNFDSMATLFSRAAIELPWRGSLDSLAGRQLKWVYSSTANDDEFLKRATLASTLLLDGLHPASLRNLLVSVGEHLHQSFDNPPNTLGSRKLLQRVALIALLVERFRPNVSELPMLVEAAEGGIACLVKSDLRAELQRAYKEIHDEFAPLAFLYDLRTHGGLAHTPNKEAASVAALKLGLPGGNWHRTDYLRLLKLIAQSISHISSHLEACCD